MPVTSHQALSEYIDYLRERQMYEKGKLHALEDIKNMVDSYRKDKRTFKEFSKKLAELLERQKKIW